MATAKTKRNHNKKAPVLSETVEQEAVKVENVSQAPAPAEEAAPVEDPRPETRPMLADVTWNPKAKKTGSKTECIVIDKDDNWHEGQMIDLKGLDVTECKWGYYGKTLPVLIQNEKTGKLQPYVASDEAVESPHRVFIASKSTGYKAYMRYIHSLLQKLQVGMMALLGIGILFLIYLLISSGGK